MLRLQSNKCFLIFFFSFLKKKNIDVVVYHLSLTSMKEDIYINIRRRCAMEFCVCSLQIHYDFVLKWNVQIIPFRKDIVNPSHHSKFSLFLSNCNLISNKNLITLDMYKKKKKVIKWSNEYYSVGTNFLSKPSKYLCSRIFFAEIRLIGLYVNIFSNKSRPALFNTLTCSRNWFWFQHGNVPL